MIKTVGCPLHLGVSNDGIIRAIDALNEAYPLNIEKIDEVICKEDSLPNLKNINGVIATCEAIACRVYDILKAGDFPLFIGGDHASAMGTVAAAAKKNNRLGLLWVDAHTDINTDETTLTGNIHGMPVAAMIGIGNKRLSSIFGKEKKLNAQDVVFFGIRDMDKAEEEIVKEHNIKVFTYEEIVKIGLDNALKAAKDYLKETSAVHVSFDLDSMDPGIIKGVSVPVKSGFTPTDAIEITEFILKEFTLSSMDIVEYNPALDSDLFTGKFLAKMVNTIIKSEVEKV